MFDLLEKASDEYFDMIITIDAIAPKRTGQDARELIALRPELSAKTQNLEIAIRKTIESYEFDENTKILLEEFKEIFANERKAVAKHQTKWAAPVMQDNRQGYENDAKNMFAMHKANHDWRKNKFFKIVK